MTQAGRRTRVAILTDVQTFHVEDVDLQYPEGDQVCVAVEACGICGSDLHMYLGHHPVLRPPLIMGHEFVGHVVETGTSVTSLADGDRVVAIAGRGCGACRACRSGHFNRCPRLQTVGGQIPGGLSERVVLPADQFVRVSESLSVATAALIEVAAVAIHTVGRCGPVNGQSCLILGAGPIGLVLTRVVKALGAYPVAVSDVSAARRDLATSSDADMVFDGSDAAAEATVINTFPDGFDIAYECVGRQDTLLQALRLTRRGGTVGLAGIFPGDCVVPMLQLQRGERSLLGVQMYDRADFDTVIHMLAEGALSLDGIVTHEYPLDRVSEAFALLIAPRPTTGKILVRLASAASQETQS